MRSGNVLNCVKVMIFLAVFAGISFAAGVKNIAVVETEIDTRSGAAAEIAPAEVGEITAELRRAAINNLPRNKYNVMTSETVYAQGSAVLAECADENCVITLGSKIGADYIVRGIIRKFQTLLTLSVEIYETEDGNLVASSDPVRTESARELLEKTADISAKMYRTFAETQNTMPVPAVPTPAPPPPAPTYTVTVKANPAKGGYVYPDLRKTTVKAGEEIALTAMPYQGYTFAGWTGAAITAADTTNQVQITVDGNMNIAANFIREAKGKGAARRGDVMGANTADTGLAMSAGGMETEGVNWYFAPKYQIPVGTPASWGGINLETGWILNGGFVGIDIGGSGSGGVGMLEAGFNLGGIYNLGNQLQLVYGGSAGLWYTGHDLEFPRDILCGAFVKLRKNYFELMYRGILNFETAYDGQLMTHQLMTGLYFSTPKREKRNEKMRFDYYIAPKYQTSVGTPDLGRGVNLEAGLIWGDGAFFGIDFGVGGHFVDVIEGQKGSDGTVGGGFCLGNVYDLWDKLQFVYGGSVGFYYYARREDVYSYYHYERANYYEANFFAPFIKLRWNHLELTYRCLVGYWEESDYTGTTNSRYGGDYTNNYSSNDGFGLNSHQLMLGLYFATHRRTKPN